MHRTIYPHSAYSISSSIRIGKIIIVKNSLPPEVSIVNYSYFDFYLFVCKGVKLHICTYVYSSEHGWNGVILGLLFYLFVFVEVLCFSFVLIKWRIHGRKSEFYRKYCVDVWPYWFVTVSLKNCDLKIILSWVWRTWVYWENMVIISSLFMILWYDREIKNRFPR